MCQPQEQKSLCFDRQRDSGWHINDHKWRERYLPYIRILKQGLDPGSVEGTPSDYRIQPISKDKRFSVSE